MSDGVKKKNQNKKKLNWFLTFFGVLEYHATTVILVCDSLFFLFFSPVISRFLHSFFPFLELKHCDVAIHGRGRKTTRQLLVRGCVLLASLLWFGGLEKKRLKILAFQPRLYNVRLTHFDLTYLANSKHPSWCTIMSTNNK